MEVGETTPEAYRPQAVLKDDRLPFVFEASGSETQYTNGFDPSPRARKIFSLPQQFLVPPFRYNIETAAGDSDSPTDEQSEVENEVAAND